LNGKYVETKAALKLNQPRNSIGSSRLINARQKELLAAKSCNA